jgi:hypothetical protein
MHAVISLKTRTRVLIGNEFKVFDYLNRTPMKNNNEGNLLCTKE